MLERLQLLRPKFLRAYMVGLIKPTIYAKWSAYGRNWGDDLNEYLINAISGTQVIYTINPAREKYFVIGSIMEQVDENSIVWGTGFISQESRVLHHPKSVHAVRGPLSRAILLSQGIAVPEIYGDPALLMPRFYNPAVEKEYQVGIVPHYIDRDCTWLTRYALDKHIRIIDIRSDTYSFVKQIKSCEMIISSSLHGMICADAYGIPAIWVEFSDRVVGDGFKFRDYFLSIHRPECNRVKITDTTKIDVILDSFTPYSVNIDLDLLYQACPFRPELASS